jgi:hypothetical protein
MLAGTVNGDDGNAFFRTTSLTTAAAKKAGTAYKPNKLTGGGSALSATRLTAAKALFDNQIDPNGNPLGFDGTTPVLIHGPTNWRRPPRSCRPPARLRRRGGRLPAERQRVGRADSSRSCPGTWRTPTT